jgi:hypothetical protein
MRELLQGEQLPDGRRRSPDPQGEAQTAGNTLGFFSAAARRIGAAKSRRTPAMTPECYQRLCELFDRAQARPTDQRATFLQQVGDDDTALRAELESMLADDQKARGEQLFHGPCPPTPRPSSRPASELPSGTRRRPPSPTTANAALAEGSARPITDGISATAVQALATMAGQDDAGDDF